MKPKFILFFLLLLVVNTVQAQLKSRSFGQSGLHCSQSLWLDSLGRFYQEAGCEGDSRIAWGNYSLNGDILYLRYANPDTMSFISSMVIKFNPDQKTEIGIQLLSLDGEPLTRFELGIDAIDSSGKFYMTVLPDKSGTIRLNSSKFRWLRLCYLEDLFHRPVRIPILNQDIQIKLSLPYTFLQYPRTVIVMEKNKTFRIKADGLYDPYTHQRVLAGKE